MLVLASSFVYRSHLDNYLFSILIQVIILTSLFHQSNYRRLLSIGLASIAVMMLYVYQSFLPTLAIKGPNMYKDVYSLLSDGINSSVLYSNMSTLCLVASYCLLFTQAYTNSLSRQLLQILFFLSIPPGLAMGSRTFQLFLLILLTIHVLIRIKNRIVLIASPILVSIILYVFSNSSFRLVSDGFETRRFTVWSRAIAEYGLQNLHKITSLILNLLFLHSTILFLMHCTFMDYHLYLCWF